MMFLLAAFILAILTQLATAHPATNIAITLAANTSDLHNHTLATRKPNEFFSWASFCNDDNCTEGCGEWVDITNDGCLAENYRRSVQFKSDYGPEVSGGLVYSPAGSCSCQSECDPFLFTSGSGCMTLNTSISYETFSYRFINHAIVFPCDSHNNC